MKKKMMLLLVVMMMMSRHGDDYDGDGNRVRTMTTTRTTERLSDKKLEISRNARAPLPGDKGGEAGR